MRKVFLLQSLAGGALFGLGLWTGLAAQPSADSPHRVEQKRIDLSGAPGMEIVASLVEIKPGESSALHFHHGVEVAYVIQGAMTKAPGEAPIRRPTGATLVNLRDARHGAFEVVGEVPFRLFTVHIVDKGKPLYDYAN